jgi:ATP-dependent exoDNAse (exonuclease V) beta subunit
MIQSTNTLYPNIVIRASAGTGKTFQLSNRFLELLNNDVALDQVLATTFTRKAAGEILDRILLRLADAALEVRACKELGEYVRDPELTRTRCRRLLSVATRNLHRMRVNTLDAFFSKIAGSFGLELGLPPGWTMVDELQDAQMRAEAIESVIAQDSATDVLTLMHLLTKGEAKRSVSDLLRDTVNQVYDVYCEATPEAWACIPRFRHVSDDRLSEAISTLRQIDFPNKPQRTACEKNLEAAEQGDWESFISVGLAAKIARDDFSFQRKEIPPCAVKEYQTLLHHARATLVGHVANQTEAAYKVLKKFHVEYQRLKQERRVLRFEDVTRRLADATMLNDVQQVAFRLDATISHLLLDEFQDTSLAQWHVLRPFARRAASGGASSSFFCVGDVKQAIYGWRGGVAEIFDALELELDRLQHTSLNRSFRSAPAVIEVVNQVFTRMVEHPNLEHYEPAIRAWRSQFEPHTTAKEDLAGYVTLEVSPMAEEDQSVDNVHDAYCAQRVAEIVRQAPGLTVGVLVRTNARVSRLIHRLRELGLHVSEEGGNPVTDSAAVEVVLSLLRLADHPGDTISRFHVAHAPLKPPFALEEWRDDVEAARLAQQIRRYILENGYGASVYEIVRPLAGFGTSRDQSRLQQLVDLAYQYQSQATLRTRAFVEFVEYQRVSDPTSADVRVMTVHQAKGLEFDAVVLPELEATLVGQRDWFVVGRPDPTKPVDRVCRHTNKSVQELLPREFQEMFEADTAQTIRESLCVLYVALTRAARALHMIVRPAGALSRLPPKSFAGLLRASLVESRPMTPGAMAFAHGDPNWCVQPDFVDNDVEPLERKPPEAAPAPVRVQLKETSRRHRRLVRRAPSSLEGGVRVKLADVFGREDMAAIQRGLILHAWFEQIEWLDPAAPFEGAPDDETLRRIGNETAETAIRLDPLIEEFRNMLQRQGVRESLLQEFYRKTPRKLGLGHSITKEIRSADLRLDVNIGRRFAIQEGATVVAGSMDRVVLIYDANQLVAADLVDFKTDVIPSTQTLNDRVEFYRPQAEAYRRSLTKILKLSSDRIAVRMLFADRGLVKLV